MTDRRCCVTEALAVVLGLLRSRSGLEIGEVTVRFGGFVGLGALAVGCTLAVWFGGVCGPCVGIFDRSEIGEVTVRFGGFVGPGAPTVGCTLAV
ncbi:hypothetical protein FH972_001042 [Carpinus fangiana]|uniref:Uncharacterized protein n=1 Tax=Carpinus fangiana TaxID=176857 RepID=A0A5N6QDM9_9ROSI|nr:hypothetical protein FH972_001042 [Carpinus fangiana]